MIEIKYEKEWLINNPKIAFHLFNPDNNNGYNEYIDIRNFTKEDLYLLENGSGTSWYMNHNYTIRFPEPEVSEYDTFKFILENEFRPKETTNKKTIVEFIIDHYECEQEVICLDEYYEWKPNLVINVQAFRRDQIESLKKLLEESKNNKLNKHNRYKINYQ
jgi:hypothetical protein